MDWVELSKLGVSAIALMIAYRVLDVYLPSKSKVSTVEVPKIVEIAKDDEAAKELAKAISDLTIFLKEERAVNKINNKIIDEKLDKLLDLANAHAVACQKCYNKGEFLWDNL